MIRIDTRLALSAAMIATLAGTSALAQTTARATGSVSTGVALSAQQTTKSYNQAPVAHVFGTPLVISSPVDAPYNADAAYSTYEGQPGYGPNAVLANGNAGAPQ
jgi:hypothetical protein